MPPTTSTVDITSFAVLDGWLSAERYALGYKVYQVVKNGLDCYKYVMPACTQNGLSCLTVLGDVTEKKYQNKSTCKVGVKSFLLTIFAA